MKIAIHHKEESFSGHWIEYCKSNAIPFKVVNCYDNDIVKQLQDCDALMWHHHHGVYKDALFAKGLLFSLEQAGIKVFPDLNTAWHFDDKIGQKYLLEAINAPLVPSHVFYNKKEAMVWAEQTTFPKVFKLRGGAGALNVKLIKSKKEALKLIKKAFGKGFKTFDGIYYFKDCIKKYRGKSIGNKKLIKALGRVFIAPSDSKEFPRERGYVYFQDFIPNNDCDYRVIIIKNKALAIKRMVRKDDFRASGSGSFVYEIENFSEDIIQLAFKTAKKMKSQSCAFDFVYDSNNIPLIVEVSYGFASSVYDACPGYWDENIVFHSAEVNPYNWMIEELITQISE